MARVQLWVAILLAGAGTAACSLGQKAADAHKLSAGPAYTSKDGKTGPKFPQVEIAVRLTGADGAPAALRAEDLKLFSASAQIASGSSLRTLGEAGYGVRAVLALDLSGSMQGAPLDAVRSTMAQFVKEAREQDRVEVVSIADDTRVEVPFGADKSTLAERLKRVTARGSLTRLYDGLMVAMDHLKAAPPELRQLTIISDGHDEGSTHTIDEVIKRALAEGIQIDSIGLTKAHAEFLKSLEQISDGTNGHYAKANSPQELNGLVERGIQAERATPLAMFKSVDLKGDGKTHSLEVRWEPGKLKAPVDVTTPQISKKWRIWVGTLGGCIVAGIILSLVAFGKRRREPETVAAGAPLPDAEESGEGRSTAEATAQSGELTMVEAGGAPAIHRTPTEAMVAVEAERTEPRPEMPARARTRVAAFFNASDGGAVLEAIAGPMAGKSFRIEKDLTIGALPGNQLTIAGDPTLSGFHAHVRLVDAVLTIEDSKSTNGTHVNGRRLGAERKLLKPNDEIRVGRSIFRVRSL